jgi:hypothetical protein
MGSLRITYASRHPDGTPEAAELDTLAAVYRFIVDCRAKQEGGPVTAPDSAKGGSSDSSARTIIPERP